MHLPFSVELHIEIHNFLWLLLSGQYPNVDERNPVKPETMKPICIPNIL